VKQRQWLVFVVGMLVGAGLRSMVGGVGPLLPLAAGCLAGMFVAAVVAGQARDDLEAERLRLEVENRHLRDEAELRRGDRGHRARIGGAACQ
jgi:hypothetical protein